MQHGKPLYDLDHVLLANGNISRVLGNFESTASFWGYNIYSPAPTGERIWRGERYRKNALEDERLREDVLDIYEVLPRSDIVLHVDPIQAAQEKSFSFRGTIWFDLYEQLKQLFGEEAVGIFGSSMFHFHLTPQGQIRRDVDFVIEGLKYVEKLWRSLPLMREQLGFHQISEARQMQQYQRYRRVFQNRHMALSEIIKRRWTGLQLSQDVVTTLRFREKSIVLPLEVVHETTVVQRNVLVSGRVLDAERSHLFPRMFTLSTKQGNYPVYVLWWKVSTPVREGDHVKLCGDRIVLAGREAIRITNFHHHWLSFETSSVSGSSREEPGGVP